MAVFMNQENIISSARAIAANMKRAANCAGYMSDNTYQCELDALKIMLDIGEANEKIHEAVSGIIEEMESFNNLGIYINGRFSPISAAIAARFNIKPGEFISSRRFLVIQREHFDTNFEMLKELPDGAMWDATSDSIVSSRFYYIRNQEEIQYLSKNEIEELELHEALLDYQLQKEK